MAVQLAHRNKPCQTARPVYRVIIIIIIIIIIMIVIIIMMMMIIIIIITIIFIEITFSYKLWFSKRIS